MTVLNVDTRVDHFRIVRHLDGGLLAETYEVFDEESKETFALKVLKREFVDDMDFSDRFHRECQVISQLENDAVVSLDRFDVTKWKHWLCYEYFEGFEIEGSTIRNLRDYLRVHPTGLQEEETVFLVGQTLQALKQAHGIGLLHRNLKPSNLMLRRGEEDRLEVKIADFAMARLVGEETFRKLWQPGEEDLRTFTTSREEGNHESDEEEVELSPAAETWMFRGPEEQAGEEAEETGDLFAVAAMAHWALTGEPLPEDREICLSADLNSGWRAWLLRCTEETPSERFPDADEALSQLPRAGTSLRYAEMPFEREGRHVERLASPYREGAERSSEGAEANLREAEQTRRILKPWATFLLILAGISFAFYGLWQLYRNAYHSPFIIYKCDHPGIDHAYKLKFGLFKGGIQWRGWFQGEMRSSSGQWSLDDDGHYHLRVSLLRKRLPEREESPRAFRAVDVLFKKQSSLDERAKDKRYKRWVDVLEYNPDLDRFLLIKRLETGNEEYFPGTDHEDRVKLYDQEAFDKGTVKKIKIHFIPFTPPDSTK